MAITPSWLAVQEPGTPNKYADTNAMTRNAQLVQREVVSLGSPNDASPESIAEILGSAPGAGVLGLVTRNIPSGMQDVNIQSPSGLATDGTLVGGSQLTQIVDPGGVNKAGVTFGGLLKVQISGAVSPISIVGTETENAPPINLRLAVLSAKANAVTPAWADGAYVPLSTDLSGGLRVTGPVTLPVTLTTVPGEGAQQLLVVDIAARRLLEEILIELKTLNANLLPIDRGVTNLRLVKEIG